MYKPRHTPKNICVFTSYLSGAGAEKQAVLLAETLAEKYNIWLLIYYGDRAKAHELENLPRKIHVRLLDGSHLKKAITLFRFFRKNSIEIIFSYLLTTNFLGGIIGHICGVKFTIGGIRSSKLDKNKVSVQRALHNKINKYTIFNNYRGVKNLAKLGFNTKKSVVIPNCFESLNGTIIRKNKNKIIILTVARFTKAKDYETAIKSVAKLIKHTDNFMYFIIGYGELHYKILNWIKKYNMENYIQVFINPDNIYDYYKKADIYLQTSIFEGLSNTIMEAMSFSLPIVTTDVGDNNILVKNGYNGFLCKKKGVDQIADRLLLLINSYQTRIEFGKNNPEIINNKFSRKNFENNYFSFINRLE